MIRLDVSVRANESNREEAIKAVKELTVCSLKEEGYIAYDTFESSARPDVFMICETWQNVEALAAHEKSLHFAQYAGIIQKLVEMKSEKFEFQMNYEAVREQPRKIHYFTIFPSRTS